MREKLTPSEISKAMETCPQWAFSDNGFSISRQFVFGSFSQAFGFMTEAALVAEKIDHHPEWTNVWRKVTVVLTTHSAKGLTELDFKLARSMDAIANNRLVSP